LESLLHLSNPPCWGPGAVERTERGGARLGPACDSFTTPLGGMETDPVTGRQIPPPGAVDLQDKVFPVHEQVEKGALNRKRAEPLVFTRGRADITKLKQKLLDDGDLVWEEAEHSRSNVQLKRFAHDEWGIRKAVFVFCDDFIKKVYHFPWWQDAAWKDCFNPVFEAIGVPPQKVVRCLLASMPPGCVIPVHHDTGHWVTCSHRVHVPIITSPDQVLFRVGESKECMQDVLFDEGRVVELNNQAKHAVTNSWTQYRVHLIFDYVEDLDLDVQELPPGTVLSQSRRSIDVMAVPGQEINLVPPEAVSPAFLIIGAQKCGTTSMYENIMHHPLVLKPKRRETHFFDWRWQQDLHTPEEQKAFYSRFYESKTLAAYPSLITGESSPSYLLHADLVIPRVKAVAPDAKLIVMLRDPAARAYSHYQMTIDSKGTPAQKRTRGQSHWVGKSFEEVVDHELEQLCQAGVHAGMSTEDFTRTCLAGLPMGHGGHSLLVRGMYALQLKPWFAPLALTVLLLLLPTQVVFLEDIAGPAEAVKSTMDGIFRHIGVPPSPVASPPPQNTRQYEDMPAHVREKLSQFFEPHNGALEGLLGREVPFYRPVAS
ncbi:unnamed protein product, partial [Chrysoparadoxa australica]